MYERRYYYISEKSIPGYLVPPPLPTSIFFFMVGDYTHMSHYKETFFKAGIPACHSKRVKGVSTDFIGLQVLFFFLLIHKMVKF